MRINLEIYDNGIVKVTDSTDLISGVKYITLEQLSGLFTSQIYQSPIMPLNVLKYKISQNNQYYLTYKEMPDGMYDLDVYGDNYTFNHPYLYWLFRLDNTGPESSIVHTRFLVSYYPPGVDTVMYTPILSNVDQNGRICWGDNSRIITQPFPKNDLYQLGNAQRIWMDSRHNHDYVRTEWDRLALQSRVRYDTEQDWVKSPLVNARTGIKIEQLFQRVESN